MAALDTSTNTTAKMVDDAAADKGVEMRNNPLNNESSVEDSVASSSHPLLAEESSIDVKIPPALMLVYLSVFIDAFGGLMAIPVLPQVVIRAHESNETFGLPVGLSFGLLSAGYQFFSVPSLLVTTKLADIFGRRVGFAGASCTCAPKLLTCTAPIPIPNDQPFHPWEQHLIIKPFFIIGFFGSCIGFMIIGFHQSFSPMLVAVMCGRALGGVFSSSPPLAHAYISDIAGVKTDASAIFRSYL